jgi:basic membrane protein A
VACEETDAATPVFHVGYNQSMADVAPTTYLAGCKINWTPYVLAAVEAVRTGKDIEDCVEGNVHGNDVGAGFEQGWVEMLEINDVITAKGTKERVQELIEQFKKGEITVFRGDYIGVNPFDATDTIDLNGGYQENANSSAPTFDYVLKNVIKIE